MGTVKNGTQLNGRILWFDGDSSFTQKTLYDYVLSGKSLDSSVYVIEDYDDVEQYNTLTGSNLGTKTELNSISNEWNIPDYYKNLDINEYMRNKLIQEIELNEQFSENDIDERAERLEIELKLFEDNNMIDVLRTAIYIVDNFKQKEVLWGTGRGSSCCCYCLYLIELHDVDSVKYKLDLTEFFKL